VEATTQRAPVARSTRNDSLRRFTTETKASFKTSELWLALGVIAAILVSAAVIKGGDTTGTDEFIARQAWLYVAIVAAAYLIGRGLAKSGSTEAYAVAPDGDVLSNSARGDGSDRS
jgi:hypothetical protein